MFLGEYPFRPPCIKLLTPIKYFCVDQPGNVKIALIDSKNWKPATKMKNILESLQYILRTTENRLKSDLQDLRNEASVNDTIRNIHVNEDDLFSYFLLMYHLMLLHLEFQLNFQVNAYNYISILILKINIFKSRLPNEPFQI